MVSILPPLAGGDHLIEVFPLFHAGPRKSLVSKDAGQLPVWILLDLLGVVGFLRLVAGDLLLAVGGYPAVGRYPLVLLFFPGCGVSVSLLAGMIRTRRCTVCSMFCPFPVAGWECRLHRTFFR